MPVYLQIIKWKNINTCGFLMFNFFSKKGISGTLPWNAQKFMHVEMVKEHSAHNKK